MNRMIQILLWTAFLCAVGSVITGDMPDGAPDVVEAVVTPGASAQNGVAVRDGKVYSRKRETPWAWPPEARVTIPPTASSGAGATLSSMSASASFGEEDCEWCTDDWGAWDCTVPVEHYFGNGGANFAGSSVRADSEPFAMVVASLGSAVGEGGTSDSWRTNPHEGSACGECQYHGHQWCNPEIQSAAHKVVQLAASRGSDVSAILRLGGRFARRGERDTEIDLIDCAGNLVKTVPVAE